MKDIGTVQDVIDYYDNGGDESLIVDNDTISLYDENDICIFRRFGGAITLVEPFLDYLDIPNQGT